MYKLHKKQPKIKRLQICNPNILKENPKNLVTFSLFVTKIEIRGCKGSFWRKFAVFLKKCRLYNYIIYINILLFTYLYSKITLF